MIYHKKETQLREKKFTTHLNHPIVGYSKFATHMKISILISSISEFKMMIKREENL